MKAMASTHPLRRVLCAGAIAAALAACGAAGRPSQQLVDARKAYRGAQASAASRYAPDDLLSAREALDRAEKAHKDDPGSAREAHLSYIAARKAQIAMMNGQTAELQRREAEARAAYQRRLEEEIERVRGSESPGAKSAPEDEREAPKPEGELESDPYGDPLLGPDAEMP